MERPTLQLDVARVDDAATVAVAGEIDLYTAASLEAEALRALEPSVARLILDFAQVTFCDSQGLAVLIRIDRRARASGATLTIVNPTLIVARVMEITGLDQVLHIVREHPDGADAEERADAPPEEQADAPPEEQADAPPEDQADAPSQERAGTSRQGPADRDQQP